MNKKLSKLRGILRELDKKIEGLHVDLQLLEGYRNLIVENINELLKEDLNGR